MTLKRSRLALCSVISILCGVTAGGQAQGQNAADADWPTHALHMIVASAPGASNDIIARAVAAELSKRLGQAVVIDNKSGAGGTVGTDYVAKAKPDGYTLLFVSSSLTTNAAAGKSLPYDPVNDLQPVSKVATGTFAVVVNNQLPVKTFSDFLAYARSHPGELNYGSAGAGGISHLGTELLDQAAGLKMAHIAYRGMAPAFTDLMSGRVQMALPSLASVKSQLDAGTIRGLATTGRTRSELMPSLPTVADSGVPGYELEIWWGIFAPARTPGPIVDRLNRELAAVIAMPQIKATLMREGAEPAPSSPAELAALVKTELAQWTKLIQDAHIVVE